VKGFATYSLENAIVRIPEMDQPGDVIVYVGLTPNALQFIYDNLPERDEFTDDIGKLIAECKEKLWERYQ
jgi:hypothetical protein